MWLIRHRIALILAFGVACRVHEYAQFRPPWQDELALAGNIQHLDSGEFFGTLLYQQLAPPYFLAAEKAVGVGLGYSFMALRVIPLVGGIVALVLFWQVARRTLPERAVAAAVLMFAAGDDLIYFSAEIKQYSTDVAAALLCLLLGLTLGARRLTPITTATLAAVGAVIVWFSHPAIFVLAGVGTVGLARAVRARDRRWADLWLLVGVTWIISFVGVHAVARRQLGATTQMWVFWGFAFPTVPPQSFWDLTWPVRRLVYFLVNPLRFDAPFGPQLSLLPALILALAGLGRVARADRFRLALLTLPVLFPLLASYRELYPFHGRLVLFLSPFPLLMIAEGLDAARTALDRRGAIGRGIVMALAFMVVGMPTVTAAYHLTTWRTRDFSRFGDRRPPSLNPYNFPFR